mmetsp:Transcript_5350/g.6855  ORF Transcript_5350/g.6855 Transcript_5350/m.6855 type:complete len:241 (+) Transcript_5350:26-748(+)
MASFTSCAELNSFMADKSYISGYSFSSADVEVFSKFTLPDKTSCPHAYRWYIHVAALTGVKCLALLNAASSAAPPVPAAKPAAKEAAPAPKKAAPAPAPAPAPAAADDDDDDDWFAEDDDEEEKPKEVNEALEKAKKAAMEKLAKKEAKQRSLCALEIKPWSTEQDLMELFKKVKKTVVREGLVWSENCELRPVAFGLKKIALTAVINQTISMDEIIEEITEDILPDEVQSMELLSMSLL